MTVSQLRSGFAYVLIVSVFNTATNTINNFNNTENLCTI